MRTTFKSFALLIVVLLLAMPLAAFAAGGVRASGQLTASGPSEAPGARNMGDAAPQDVPGDIDRLRTRDQLQDGSCAVEGDDEPAMTQTRTRQMEQARTQTHAGVVEDVDPAAVSADQARLRDQDKLRDGSCDDVVVEPEAASADRIADSASPDQLRERDTLADRLVVDVPAGIATWFQSMLQFFGLKS
ncbi:MAG: hypothetical protein KJ747_06550 [Actinobacteria bacterium]|nr:hypothetical protein [Actinomycetota bacterium]MCG2807461.1 hypothetical protein [Coriobacteriia bacterium]